MAFQLGALAAVIEFAILIPILKTKLSRLITGVNLFLIFGGLGFYFEIGFLLDILSQSRESGLMILIFLVCLLATAYTRTGIFEAQFSSVHHQKKFSIYYLILCLACVGFSWLNQGNNFLAGTVPVVTLVLVKYFMGKHLARSKSSIET